MGRIELIESPVGPIRTSEHDSIVVIRDDLFPGGTKARFVERLFDGHDEVVYATPVEGGAQFALATVALRLGKRVTLFCAKRRDLHPRTIQAHRLGARVVQVDPGYLSVCRARAEAYAQATGARLIPFGLKVREAQPAIIAVARAFQAHYNWTPDEWWCASGSGVLACALATAFPTAIGNAVQVGHKLTADDVGAAIVHVYPRPFGKVARVEPPFPSDPHYDAKAWEMLMEGWQHRDGVGRRMLFWNVTGPAEV